MYGNEPGAERRLGALNQHAVSRLPSARMVFWVLHTKGESPVSVLISALTREAHRKLMGAEELNRWINETIISIEAASLTLPPLTREQYDRVKDENIRVWGNTMVSTLGALANSASISCVLGYTIVEESK